jgi:hypothetical protein
MHPPFQQEDCCIHQNDTLLQPTQLVTNYKSNYLARRNIRLAFNGQFIMQIVYSCQQVMDYIDPFPWGFLRVFYDRTYFKHFLKVG